jgi:hypothetical protein
LVKYNKRYSSNKNSDDLTELVDDKISEEFVKASNFNWKEKYYKTKIYDFGLLPPSINDHLDGSEKEKEKKRRCDFYLNYGREYLASNINLHDSICLLLI